MKILGIDPGTGIMGFGVIKKDGHDVKMLDAGVIRTHKDDTDHDRLLELYDCLQEIIETNKPDAMVVEKLFFGRNVTTVMTVSQARGIALLVGAQAKIPIYEYTPMQIKMALTGYGKADKKQIQEMVRVILKLKEIPKPDDAADALAAALTYAQSS
jgi:crossover junction endodeoxyribonuclease RuvC